MPARRSASRATRRRPGSACSRPTPSCNAARRRMSIEHLADGVPDLRLETIPAGYERLLRSSSRSTTTRSSALRAFAPRLAELCRRARRARHPGERAARRPAHEQRLRPRRRRLRVLDWGDSSIGHPFCVARRDLPLPGGDDESRARRPVVRAHPRRVPRAVGRRDAGHVRAGQCVGIFAHAIAWIRQRDRLPDRSARGSTAPSRSSCGARSPLTDESASRGES